MANNKDNKVLNVPNLRFPEFSGEWEKCCIKDFGDIITGNTPPTKNSEYYSKGVKLWASPADLGKYKYVEKTNTKLSQVGFQQTRILPIGSILVTCIGSTIGKMGMTTYEMSTNQQINSIITNTNSDRNFVYYTIQHAFPRYLSEVAVQAVPILSKSNFEKLPNHMTNIEEQRKIGTFIDFLDQRISTQNKIIEKLQSLIKGITFNVTNRGKKEKSISDCLECHTSTLQENSLSEKGRYPAYGASGISGYKDNASIHGESILIIKDGSNVGMVSYANGDYSVIGTLNYLTAKNGFNLRYLYFCLKVFDFTPYKTGMAIPHIYFKDYGKANIFCPHIEEQSRIANALAKLECKLAIELNINSLLMSKKQYLLQQMFI